MVIDVSGGVDQEMCLELGLARLFQQSIDDILHRPYLVDLFLAQSCDQDWAVESENTSAFFHAYTSLLQTTAETRCLFCDALLAMQAPQSSRFYLDTVPPSIEIRVGDEKGLGDPHVDV